MTSFDKTLAQTNEFPTMGRRLLVSDSRRALFHSRTPLAAVSQQRLFVWIRYRLRGTVLFNEFEQIQNKRTVFVVFDSQTGKTGNISK
jgi:hypothetical protein